MRGLNLIVLCGSLLACLQAPSPGAASSGGAGGTADEPVAVMDEIHPRPELEAVSGVAGWVVNGDEISVEEVQRRATLYHGPYVLQDMVAGLLLEQEARRRGTAVSEGEVEAKLEVVRQELGLRSEAALARYLRTERVTMDWLRAKARDYALLEKVFADQVYVSDQDVERVYSRNPQAYRVPESVEFRALSFRTNRDAEAALREIRKGRRFTEVAKQYPPNTGERRVEVRGQRQGLQSLPGSFEQVLFSAPLNQVTGPVEIATPGLPGQPRLPNVWYLIRVEKKTDAHQPTVEEVRPIIREQLRRYWLEQKVWPEWMKEQLASADIKAVKLESSGSVASPSAPAAGE
jgi:parvulin-like peptidyl-prolyl isomerase